MAYHDLTRDSGGDETSRVLEMHKIVGMLEECMEELSETERTFVEQMADSSFCSVKQLFYLRDIKGRYL